MKVQCDSRLLQELPDLFQLEGGGRVDSSAAWSRRRRELLELIQTFEYGHIPPKPSATLARLLHYGNSPARLPFEASFRHYRVTSGDDPRLQFRLELLIPKLEGKLPVVLNGDDCWLYASAEDVMAEVIQRGYILARFSRVELAPDDYQGRRDNSLYLSYGDSDFGAVAAWAWGYHRCVDVLETLDFVDNSRIAVVGHSRGGKASLLAGATDERIALTAANDSGCCGAGCFRWKGEGAETIADILKPVPYWFCERFKDFIGKEAELPFDQHAVKALVAPRPLLTLEATGDLWANPEGTWLTHLAAREAYKFLGAEDKIGIWYRGGGHGHGLEDWRALLDFADLHFKGVKSPIPFDINPYPELPKAFSWSAPAR